MQNQNNIIPHNWKLKISKKRSQSSPLDNLSMLPYYFVKPLYVPIQSRIPDSLSHTSLFNLRWIQYNST